MAAIFSIIVSTRIRNDLHAFKMNSSSILFNSSSIAVLSKPIRDVKLYVQPFIKEVKQMIETYPYLIGRCKYYILM